MTLFILDFFSQTTQLGLDMFFSEKTQQHEIIFSNV